MKIIAANWKMNGSVRFAEEFVQGRQGSLDYYFLRRNYLGNFKVFVIV